MDQDRFAIIAPDGAPIQVRLRINPRARRILLRLDRESGEPIAISPNRQMVERARSFAQSKADWIAERLQKSTRLATPFQPGAQIPVRGRWTMLTADDSLRVARLVNGQEAAIRAPTRDGLFAARVLRLLVAQARLDLTARVQVHAEMVGGPTPVLAVKDTKTRWGSCRQDGKMSFSWRLVLAPPPVLNYVAAHECAHLRHMNHSKSFWDLVRKLDPDMQRWRLWLKEHGASLHRIGARSP